MRHILLGLLTSVGVAASVQTLTAQAQPASDNPMTPPILCVSQSDALSKEVAKRGMARNLCVQTVIVANLDSTGDALAKAVHSYAPFPDAYGPNAITCRKIARPTARLPDETLI